MEEKDLQQIGQLIEEKVPRLIDEKINPLREDFARMIEENINPQFEEINGRLNRMEATMVTKDYLDNKLADIKGELNVEL
ncbi:MAG: hypothetical protein V1692_01430, partial [bacterium]